MRKEIGIWLDTNKAVLVSLLDGKNENVSILESEVESRTRFPGEKKPSRVGSLLSNAENKITNRKKQQKHHYFSEIMKTIDEDTQALFLFGPAKTKIELEKELRKHQPFSHKPLVVESADKMTEKQMIAHVKSFFDKNNSKNA